MGNMFIGCLAGIPLDLDKLVLMSASIAMAIATFLSLKKFSLSTKSKIALIYGHIIFLFFPVVLFTTNIACGAGCVMSCYNNMYNLIALSLPTTLIIGTIASLFIVPGMYMLYNKKSSLENRQIETFVGCHSRMLGISRPKVYVIDSANPVAFSFRSFRSAIFVSAGLLDILGKKETEAVLLHELGHIKRRSSVFTSSVSLFRLLTPFALLYRFHYDSYKEEEYADQFAISIQKTSRWIRSAKKNIDLFEEIGRKI